MLYFVIRDSGKKIDLSHLNVIFNEENDWFSREVKSDYSFPITLPKKELLTETDFTYNSVTVKKQYPGYLYRDGEVLSATLKLDKIKGKFLECIIFMGSENIPGFNQKLNTFPLQVVSEIEDMKEHALDKIVLDYPDTNYNFPMVHTNNYDASSAEFFEFKGILNNYEEGAFVENELVTETNVDRILNIMQPFAYLMYVLKTALESVGFTLSGDILQIQDLNKALLFKDARYFVSLGRDSIPFRYKITEWTSNAYIKNNIQHVLYNKSIEIEKKGDYILFGEIYSAFYRFSAFNIRISDLFISVSKISGGVPTLLFTLEIDGADITTSEIKITRDTRSLDIPVSFESGDTLQITKVEAKRDLIPPILQDYPEAVSLSVIPIRYRNEDDSPIISLLDLNEVDLKKVVPDMTLSELIMQVRLSKNLDMVFNGNEIVMNFISPQINRSDYVDLSEYEVEEPERPVNDDRSYELKYKDGKQNPEYIYDSVFVTAEGDQVINYTVKKDTEPIELDFLPLPVITRDNVTTAFALDDEQSKLRLIFFNAIDPEIEEIPVCFDNVLFTIPNIYNNHYKRWINFLINSISNEWEFIIPVEKFKGVTAKTIVFCYGNFQIFRELQRERLLINSNQYWRVTPKTESLPLTADPSS